MMIFPWVFISGFFAFGQWKRLRRWSANCVRFKWVRMFRSPSEGTALRLGRNLRLLFVGPLAGFHPTPQQGCSVSGKAALCPRSRSRLPIGVRLSRPYQTLSTLGLTGSSSCTAPGTEFLDFQPGRRLVTARSLSRVFGKAATLSRSVPSARSTRCVPNRPRRSPHH